MMNIEIKVEIKANIYFKYPALEEDEFIMTQKDVEGWCHQLVAEYFGWA